MIAAIHQPNYLPWIGFFHKIKTADTFVILDNVQFTKGGYQNRCAIKTPSGLLWLTEPVLSKNKSTQLTNEVAFNPTERWLDKHLKTIEMNYKNAPYFNSFFPTLEKTYREKEWPLLSEFNTELIKQICMYLQIKTPFIIASDLDSAGSADTRLVEICKEVGADVYLSGKGGGKYQLEETFTNAGIRLTYSIFNHPVYSQKWGDFVANASIIDLIFNEGQQSINLI